MSVALWPIVLAPFAGALVLVVFGAYMPKKAAGAVGCVTVGASWVMAMIAMGEFLSRGSYAPVDAKLYEWIAVGSLRVPMSLHLDTLSAIMIVVITFVAFVIHLYSAQSMAEEDGYSRFFAYMNLFVGSMLVLVLAGNLLLLYLGWEGVGLCSYLLIGYWYKDSDNGRAAQKAFIVTRIGDTALAVGLFLLFVNFRTFSIADLSTMAPGLWAAGSAVATVTAFLIIGGAIGKSAQVPLQTWLPDAMAGPTPVSALIHAATMVTAGVYLIARLNFLFTLAPAAQLAVAVIGAVTLVYAGFSALAQTDIKRVLAYSTISQIGYMFLALGVGAWSAAIFHFITHAFFKALLFLSAGIVIDALHHERDLFRMGGMARRLPVAYWTFLAGAASLSALPLVTAGFYSKDTILYAAWASKSGGVALWVGGIVGALLTSAYAFRALFLAFLGEQRREPEASAGGLEKLAVTVLAFLSIVGGFVGIPAVLGGFNPFDGFMSHIFASFALSEARLHVLSEAALITISSLVSLIGIYFAYVYFTKPALSEAVDRSPAMRRVHAFLLSGWGFDWLYDRAIVRPFKAIAFGNQSDFIDAFYKGLAALAAWTNRALSLTQTGRLRDYAAGVVVGAVVLGVILLVRLQWF